MLVLPDTDKEKEVRYCLKAIISNNLDKESSCKSNHLASWIPTELF